MDIFTVQKRIEHTDDEMSPCTFYPNGGCHTGNDCWCDNKMTRGFTFCPRDKKRCYKDMLEDIFDAVRVARGD